MVASFVSPLRHPVLDSSSGSKPPGVRTRVLSVGTSILGNAIYHKNACASLQESALVEVIPRSLASYWDFPAKLLFGAVATPRLSVETYRYRAEWVMSEVARRGIRRDLRKMQVDVVHCHTQAHALRCHRIGQARPLVVTMDATSRLLYAISAYAGQRSALHRIGLLEMRLFATCAAIGGVSEWVNESLRNDYQIPEERVRLCPPCVDIHFFKPRRRESPEALSGKARILFVGNDLERKGGQMLLDLMAEGLHENCELHIVSSAVPPKNLPSSVFWYPQMEPCSPGLLEQYQRADLFVLPTNEDCFPMALIEAMACGLPLISTLVMAVPELVRNDENGLCIPAGNKVALKQAICTIAFEHGLRNRLSRESRRLACEHFSYSASQQSYEALFTEL